MKKDKSMRNITTLIMAVFLAVISIDLFVNAKEQNELMSELSTAIKDNNRTYVQQLTQKLVDMGDKAIPVLKKGIDIKNKALTGQTIKILKEIKTQDSTKMLLNLTSKTKDKFVRLEAMQVLQYRDIDAEVEQQLLNFILEQISVGQLPTAPVSARILGKMNRIDPNIRATSLVSALQKEISKELSEPNESLLPDAYVTATQYKIRQITFAIEDMGASATPIISKTISDTQGNYKKHLVVCLALTGDRTTAKELEKILEESEDGHNRSLSAYALGKIGSTDSINILKKALEDKFSITYKSNGITKEIFPVREMAITSLLKMGVNVKRVHNKFFVEN